MKSGAKRPAFSLEIVKMDKDEKILLASVEDKAKRCEQKNIPASTRFLDMHEQSLAEGIVNRFACRHVFWGGFDDAERKILVFLPDYLEDVPEDALCAVHITSRGAAKLTHRDYLGSALGCGIKREQIGDILVENDGAYAIVIPDIADFLCSNLIKIGREHVSCEAIALSDLNIAPAEPAMEMHVSVSSLRLDKMVAETFKVSRTDAAGAVLSGRVFVNGKEILKPDYTLSPFDKITFRGKGKAKLNGIEGVSKKGKTRVVILKY